MYKLIATLVCVLLLAVGCRAKDDTQAVRELIDKGARLAEKKQISDLLDLASADFVAQPGHHDAQSLKGILFAAFMHYGRFKIHYPQPVVELAADKRGARSSVYFVIVRQDRDLPKLKELYHDPRGWLEAAGRIADLYQLKLEMNLADNQWQVRQAHLEGFKGTGF